MNSSLGISLSQFICCSGRSKRTSIAKVAGAGTFPFDEGSNLVLSDVSACPGEVSISCLDGLVAITTSNQILVLGMSFDANHSEDRWTVDERLTLPANTKSFFPFNQIIPSAASDRPAILALCNSISENDEPVLWLFDDSSDVSTFAFPNLSRKITNACAVPASIGEAGGITTIASTADNCAHFWSLGSLRSSDVIEGPIDSVSADSRYGYVSTKEGKIFIYALASGKDARVSLVSSISAALTDLTIACKLLRPRTKNPSSGDRPLGSLYLMGNGGLSLIPLNPKEERISEQFPKDSSNMLGICFGPFDNGPVMTWSNKKIYVWETGYCVRPISEYPMEEVCDISACDADRHQRVLVVSIVGPARNLLLTSFGLRALVPPAVTPEDCI